MRKRWRDSAWLPTETLSLAVQTNLTACIYAISVYVCFCFVLYRLLSIPTSSLLTLLVCSIKHHTVWFISNNLIYSLYYYLYFLFVSDRYKKFSIAKDICSKSHSDKLAILGRGNLKSSQPTSESQSQAEAKSDDDEEEEEVVKVKVKKEKKKEKKE